MKVLWVSSRIFDEADEKQSGVWQKALAEKLAEEQGLILGNISYQDGITVTTYSVYKTIHQWGIPRFGKVKNGVPPEKVCRLFSEAVMQFNPDIIHIWGSENPFKLLPFRSDLSGIKVLAIQGLLSSMGLNCLPWFTIKELLSMIGLREIIKGGNVFSVQRSFVKEGRIEDEMIKICDYVISQSEWTESHLLSINKNIKYFRTHRALREPFVKCKKWDEFEHNEFIIYTSSYGYTWKALYILIRALPIIKIYFPKIQLRIAGNIGRTDFLGEGYLRYIVKLIKKSRIADNIKWLGPLNADQTVHELQQASVYVNPSNVESYSNTLAEAMSVGTPSVVTFAGAMPELADNNKEALYFTIGDYKRCAHLIIKLLCDEKLSTEISQNALKRSLERNKIKDVASNQMDIYRKILGMTADC